MRVVQVGSSMKYSRVAQESQNEQNCQKDEGVPHQSASDDVREAQISIANNRSPGAELSRRIPVRVNFMTILVYIKELPLQEL
jgi:hypothetical protein